MELLITALVIGLLVYGLERNRTSTPASGLAGSTDVQDRDTERVTHDLLVHP
jgi:hypothetical protein